MIDLTEAERQAVNNSVRNSIALYSNYVKLRPETPAMARKQGQKRKHLAALETALPKLVKQKY
jgi:hypothetical protein